MITLEIFETEEAANARNSELNDRFDGRWSSGYGPVIEVDGKYGIPVSADGPFPVNDSGDTEEIAPEDFVEALDAED
tara:strand:+ start:2559 stop:2789 length:231 start_codon:yes stop_codon:yes gene_type:complete